MRRSPHSSPQLMSRRPYATADQPWVNGIFVETLSLACTKAGDLLAITGLRRLCYQVEAPPTVSLTMLTINADDHSLMEAIPQPKRLDCHRAARYIHELAWLPRYQRNEIFRESVSGG